MKLSRWKKVVSALVFGTYKSDANIIYSESNSIVILINDKKSYPNLERELDKFLTA
jgi:hypothetical protein